MRMKHLLLIAATVGILCAGPAQACTALIVSDGERVLVGNNEDWFNPFTRIWFIQPGNNRHGAVCFGFDDGRIQGGMNEKGLFFDGFSLAEKPVGGQEGKPRFKNGNLIKEALLTCATVEEALALMERFSRHFMGHFQLFLADAGGDAAIVEGEAVIRKQGAFQVVTNFRQSEIGTDDITCPRYRIANDLLAGSRTAGRDLVRRVLAATHNEGGFPTVYSNIYDLKARRVYLYHFHNFQEEVVIDLQAELALGRGIRDIYTLFGPNHAADRFRAQYTELTQVYTHATRPRFTVRYPAVCQAEENADDDLVFLARGRHGQVPVLSVAVAPADVPLEQVGSLVLMPRLRRVGSHVSITANIPVRLSDGSLAYESRFTWRWNRRQRVNSLALSTVREGTLVNVVLHHSGDLDALKHIPYSLAFGDDF